MTISGAPDWRNPPLVTGPRHDDRSQIATYSVSGDITALERSGVRVSPLFWLWAHLLRALPPVPGVEIIEQDGCSPTLLGLDDAVACFQGLKRPHINEQDGNSVLIYILKPEFTVEYFRRVGFPIRALPFPSNRCLTVQVRLSNSLQEGGEGVSGVVTRLEPVECESVSSALPLEHATRYALRHW